MSRSHTESFLKEYNSINFVDDKQRYDFLLNIFKINVKTINGYRNDLNKKNKNVISNENNFYVELIKDKVDLVITVKSMLDKLYQYNNSLGKREIYNNFDYEPLLDFNK